jgi:hypothetical protein
VAYRPGLTEQASTGDGRVSRGHGSAIQGIDDKNGAKEEFEFFRAKRDCHFF